MTGGQQLWDTVQVWRGQYREPSLQLRIDVEGFPQGIKPVRAFERAMGGLPVGGLVEAAERAEKHDELTVALRQEAAEAVVRRRLQQPVRSVVVHYPGPPAPEDLGPVWNSLRDTFSAAAEAFVRLARAAGKAHRITQADYALMPPPGQNKWERALWLRDHRNTGPPTPAAWRHRSLPPKKTKTGRARGPVVQHQRRVKGYPNDKARI